MYGAGWAVGNTMIELVEVDELVKIWVQSRAMESPMTGSDEAPMAALRGNTDKRFIRCPC
jgi:hypothetical protein